MDVISVKVNFVIVPVDGFTGEALTGGYFARTSEGKYAVKKDGCLVFFGLATGKYEITVGGERYISKTLTLEAGDECQTAELTLMPSRNYHFGSEVTKLSGRISDGTGKVEIIFPVGSSSARIIGEYKKGETVINAFLSDVLVRTNAELSIDGARYRLTKMSVSEFRLSEPLKKSVGADSKIGVVCEVSPNVGGEYFLAVRGRFETASARVNGRLQTLELHSGDNEFDF